MKSDEAKVFTFAIATIAIVILGYNFIYSNPSSEQLKKELTETCLENYRSGGPSGTYQQVTPDVINACTDASIRLLNSKGPT